MSLGKQKELTPKCLYIKTQTISSGRLDIGLNLNALSYEYWWNKTVFVWVPIYRKNFYDIFPKSLGRGIQKFLLKLLDA